MLKININQKRIDVKLSRADAAVINDILEANVICDSKLPPKHTPSLPGCAITLTDIKLSFSHLYPNDESAKSTGRNKNALNGTQTTNDSVKVVPAYNPQHYSTPPPV